MSGEKVLNKEQLNQTIDSLKKNSKTIVFTNGCFDILHPGHVAYLEEAKLLGDVLVVGVNSDKSVKRLKGESRPINDFFFRSLMLAALESVNFVIEFNEDTPLNLIKLVSPSILVKGNDYAVKKIIGHDFVESIGGETITIPFIDGFSSSAIISKIQRLT